MATRYPEGPMGLEELARFEARALAEHEAKRRAWAAAQERFVAEVPERFHALAKELRRSVERWNRAAQVPRPARYEESAAVTSGERAPWADLHLEVRRDPSRLSLALREMQRHGRPPALIIDGTLATGYAPDGERTSLRIEPFDDHGRTAWRVGAGGARLDVAIDELPERLVAAVVTGDARRLRGIEPPKEPPSEPEA
jgi:hypothetical protein